MLGKATDYLKVKNQDYLKKMGSEDEDQNDAEEGTSKFAQKKKIQMLKRNIPAERTESLQKKLDKNVRGSMINGRNLNSPHPTLVK